MKCVFCDEETKKFVDMLGKPVCFDCEQALEDEFGDKMRDDPQAWFGLGGI